MRRTAGSPERRGGAAVAVRGLRHGYVGPDGPITVLDAVDLDVPAGGYLAVVGRSGAGKSTLLAVLGGLDAPQAGVVEVGGIDLAGLRGDALSDYRRTTVGFVFQHFGLLDFLTALENVELAGTLDGRAARRRRARAAELLAAVGMTARAGHRPPQLSGGERQRVAIARAMANRPRLLLADEPTGNLDGASADAVIALLEALRTEHGCTLVVVTHHRELAGRADAVLDLGRRAPVETAGAVASP